MCVSLFIRFVSDVYPVPCTCTVSVDRMEFIDGASVLCAVHLSVFTFSNYLQDIRAECSRLCESIRALNWPNMSAGNRHSAHP